MHRHAADGGRLLLDVRSVEEFAGGTLLALARGRRRRSPRRLPRAMHRPAERLRDEAGALRSRDELTALCEAAGLARDRAITAYCTIGNRESQVWFALTHVLGLPDVDVYYGSWAEWGTDPDTPVGI